MSSKFKIAVLISGGGTTLKNLLKWQNENRLSAEVCLVVSSNPDAGGLKFASENGISAEVVSVKDYDSIESFSESIFQLIREAGVQLVVMGGFLRRVKIPFDFENRVVNIHPSLIPAFCGQGMYGTRVHRAVLDYGAKLSGCTVHFVDDQYDHGPIIAQKSVEVESDDTPATLAKKVFAEECQLYPRIINAIAEGRVHIQQRSVMLETNV
ncbi:MAG: phosphoribosylglycinamide formyltransferase [Planctomycetota bacterium]